MGECYKLVTRFPHSSNQFIKTLSFSASGSFASTSASIPLSSVVHCRIGFEILCAMAKLQVSGAAAAAVCLVLLLMASEMVITSEAAGCDIFQLVPCMAAGKNARVAPSKQCCANIAKMGKGLPGAKCLCSLLSHRLAKSNGVVPRIALAIPQKCRIAVPKGFVCQGIRVPGS